MDRRTFIGRCAGTLLGAPFAARAQQAAGMPRIGVLNSGKEGTGTERLRQGFRDLGYVEGSTVVIEWRWWAGNPQRLRETVAELVQMKPDVIVCGGSEATRALKDATRSIPIVFMGPSYPVEEGLVESFARPGGNVTGITMAQSDHVAKLLQLLRDVAPALSSAGVIWSPANRGSALTLKDLEAAARDLNIRLVPITLAASADADPALAALESARAGAVILLPSPVPIANVERIGQLAIRLRLPSITALKAVMERGLLMSYGADGRDVERRIPGYVDRILKGAKPAEMPVERPTKFELAINLKVAKAIGLTIPQALLLRADDLIRA